MMLVMRIAFDLDDTLIPTKYNFAVEPPRRSWWGWLWGVERLRKGTQELLTWLTERGNEIWIYTSSIRSPRHIHRTFHCYGAKLGGVVNGDLHLKHVIRLGDPYCYLFKYPPIFGIDFLVDDSVCVKSDGERFHFSVIVVEPYDEDWVNTIKRRLG